MSCKTRRMTLSVVITGLVVAAGVVVWQFNGGSDDAHVAGGSNALREGNLNGVTIESSATSSTPGIHDLRRLRQGEMLLRTGRLVEAETWLAGVDREGEHRREALLLLGEYYYRQQRLAEAETCFLEMEEDDPDDVDAHRWLSAIDYDLGRITDAINQLEHVIRLEPADFRSHRFLGVIYQDLRRHLQAADAYQKALNLNLPLAIKKELQLDLARMLVDHKEYERALALLDQAPELAGNPAALSIRAECASTLGQTDKAQRLVSESLKALPDDRDALLLSARLAKDDQRWDEAVSSLVRLLGSHPHDFEARYMLARAYAMQGDRENSEREMKLCEHSKSLKVRASNLTEQANKEPDNAAVREELARICEKLGESKLATHWRRAAQALKRRNRMSPHVGHTGTTGPRNRNDAAGNPHARP